MIASVNGRAATMLCHADSPLNAWSADSTWPRKATMCMAINCAATDVIPAIQASKCHPSNAAPDTKLPAICGSHTRDLQAIRAAVVDEGPIALRKHTDLLYVSVARHNCLDLEAETDITLSYTSLKDFMHMIAGFLTHI